MKVLKVRTGAPVRTFPHPAAPDVPTAKRNHPRMNAEGRGTGRIILSIERSSSWAGDNYPRASAYVRGLSERIPR